MRLHVIVMVALALAIPGRIAAQAPRDQIIADREAAVAVAADLEIDQVLLAEDLARYEELTRKRARALDRLGALYSSLDDAVRGGEERADLLMQEVERAEAERDELLNSERRLVDGIRERRRRIQLLRERLEVLGAVTQETRGALTGRWDLVLLPLEQRGSFDIRQTGTILSGTYQLEGGWTGSLQGTLVNRKVCLVRIDSKLGRSMEFEGYLAGDGRRIRGSWVSYELAAGEGSTGQWSAQKRSAAAR